MEHSMRAFSLLEIAFAPPYRGRSERRIYGSEILSRRNSCAQAPFLRMIIRSALQSIFSAAVFLGGRSVASVGIENQNAAISGDLGWLLGLGVLVELVEA
jgi:hypothetical protein